MTRTYSAQNSSRFYLHQAIRKSLGPAFAKIRLLEEFYPWARHTLLPHLYGDGRGERLPREHGPQPVTQTLPQDHEPSFKICSLIYSCIDLAERARRIFHGLVHSPDVSSIQQLQPGLQSPLPPAVVVSAGSWVRAEELARKAAGTQMALLPAWPERLPSSGLFITPHFCGHQGCIPWAASKSH